MYHQIAPHQLYQHAHFSMKNHTLRTTQKGLSLVETVIFVALMTLVLSTVLSTTITTGRVAKADFNRVYATRYADEMIEWLRYIQSTGWQEFYTTIFPSAAPVVTTYCANRKINLESVFAVGPSNTLEVYSPTTCRYAGLTTDGLSPTPGPRIFMRTVTFTPATQGSVVVEVSVSWLEGTAVQRVVSRSAFKP
jgi:hypothetical protein